MIDRVSRRRSVYNHVSVFPIALIDGLYLAQSSREAGCESLLQLEPDVEVH